MREYREFLPEKTQQIRERHRVGSLFAKCAEGAGWTDETIGDILSEPAHSAQRSEALERIRDRILLAKERREKIFIGGDYDSDGLCATAALVRLFGQLGIPCGYYIPDRFSEGYGLNPVRTKQALDKGYGLFVTVDNGVGATEALQMIDEAGKDAIVLDHHQMQGEVPCAYLFHPQIERGDFSWLCGSGCAYEAARMFEGVDLSRITVLAMIGTIADMMELKRENRWIVKEGLRLLNEQGYPAVEALLPRKREWISEEDVAFQAAPRLNAAGRMADLFNANRVVRMLASEDPKVIGQTAEKLHELNQARREMTKDILRRVREMELSDRFAVAYQEDFHTGIVGLAANALMQERGIPAMVAGKRGGKITASIRTPRGVDIMPYLERIRDHLSAYGGHASAAGMTMEEKEYPFVRGYLESLSLPAAQREQAVVIRREDLSLENLEEISAHHPYGEGAKLPALWLQDPSYGPVRQLGGNPDYRRWDLGPQISALTFEGDRIEGVSPDGHEAMVGFLKENVFRGKRSWDLQLEEHLR